MEGGTVRTWCLAVLLLLPLLLGALADRASDDEDGADDAEDESSTPSSLVQKQGERVMSEQVLALLDHFRQEDPKGLPGAPVPDPMDIPDNTKSFTGARITLKESKVYGLSQFRIEHVRTNLKDTQMSVGVSIEKLEVVGRYTLRAWLSGSHGPYTVTMTGVQVEGLAMLEVQRDGSLAAEEIQMDISFSDIDMNFENLGFMGTVFQGILNSVGTFIFDSIKPFILKEVNKNVRGDINKNVAKIPQRFPNSISPFDTAMFDVRKKIREMGYDPMGVPNFTWEGGHGTLVVDLSGMMMTGLATFHRVGEVTIDMERKVVSAQKLMKVRRRVVAASNGTSGDTAVYDAADNSTANAAQFEEEVEELVVFERRVDPEDEKWAREPGVSFIEESNVLTAHAQVGTKRLRGSCHWDASLAGLVTSSGLASFTVDYIQVTVSVSQPLDTRKRPTLDSLLVRIGNIQARIDGLGTADYVAELIVNVLPNLLRQQIMSAFAEPLRLRVQKELLSMDVDRELRRRLPEMDQVFAQLQQERNQ
ncbi:uncharacterized protein LOC126262276 [Schistocerca nitens]|uniref:uncharacterized protein LOC126262276 n=1 Tax=Schistocerca nitens TaxID=7011 RepID=UPI002117FCDE|nr:uncharacterized protein LOC126262276 [Schistocerca nitens]